MATRMAAAMIELINGTPPRDGSPAIWKCRMPTTRKMASKPKTIAPMKPSGARLRASNSPKKPTRAAMMTQMINWVNVILTVVCPPLETYLSAIHSPRTSSIFKLLMTRRTRTFVFKRPALADVICLSRMFLLFPGTAASQVYGCLTIQDDEQVEQECVGEVARQGIGDPVRAGQHAGIANDENIQNSEDLEWQQHPVITPLAYGFCKAQIQQEAIIGY